MPVYTYSAADRTGKVRRARAQESDERALERILEREKKALIRIHKVEDKSSRPGWYGKAKKSDLIDLAYHLSIMTAAGIPLINGLTDFAEQRAAPRFKRLLDEVVRDVNDGLLLSEAMAKRARAFGNIFINLTRAGEASGSLDLVMERFYKEMEWQSRIKGQLLQALVYPAFLSLALTGLVVLLLTFLLPRVMGLFPPGMALPMPTRILIACSEVLQSHWVLLLIFAVMIPSGIKIVRLTGRGRYLTDALLMRLPLVGGVVHDIAVARFLSTFRTLHASGVEIVRALQIAGQSAGNCVIETRAGEIREDITKGALLSEAFGKVGEFNSMVKNLIGMSEKTGQTSLALERITTYFDTVIPRRVKKMLAVMEPLVIILAGLIVGFVLAGTMMPIFTLYSSV